MAAENIVMLQHLLIALLAGGLIGLERGYHGRPAGFRTHALVCVASSALIAADVSGCIGFLMAVIYAALL